MPASDTMIEEAVSPVLHNKLPPALVDNTVLPQLLVTVTSGADGIDLGAAIPEPAALVQPFTVCITV